MRGPVKDALVTFGVLSGMFTAWQMLETVKARQKLSQAEKERKDIVARLRRIEQKLPQK